MDAAQVLAGLDEEQGAAVRAPVGPVRILAGAGTGKTRTITHRIAYQDLTGQMPATAVLAVTHSVKAAAEMRSRLAGLGVPRANARTFHAAALRQLTHFWPQLGTGTPLPKILGDNRSLIREALAAAQRLHPGAVAAEQVLTTTAEIAWAAAQLVSPDRYPAAARAAGRDPDVPTDLVAAAYRSYIAAKRDRGVMDFDDVLAGCTRMLDTHPHIAAQVRAGYRGFVVDEYQDTDPAQQRLLDAWLGGRDAVTVVGDTSQAIFAFKGADASLLRSFPSRYPGVVDVALVRDYRSTPQIVTAANALVAGRGGLELVGQRPDGPKPRVVACDDEEAEAAAVAGQVRSWLDGGVPASQIAVLHRFNSQAPALRAALAGAGVGARVSGGESFYDAPEIRRVTGALAESAAAEPDTDALVLLAEALDAAGFDERQPPPGQGARRGRWENQLALLEMGRDLAATGLRAADLAAELARRSAAEHGTAHGAGVQVMTIHKAKGLEWDAVVVARMADGSLPSALATTAAERAEERRLAYVAVTRAREHLVCTWAKARREGWSKQKPSPYLAQIAPPTPRRAVPAHPRAAAPHAGHTFTAGQRVSHDRFGLGTVLVASGNVLDVDFGGDSPRRVRVGRDPIEPL